MELSEDALRCELRYRGLGVVPKGCLVIEIIEYGVERDDEFSMSRCIAGMSTTSGPITVEGA